MERKSKGLSLADGLLADLGGTCSNALLTQLDQRIPWDIMVKPVQSLYRNNSTKGGRPNVPVRIMLKITLMQRWFGLSDEAMEDAIQDRLSFRRFLGLGIDDPGIDHSTIAIFRKRLHDSGLLGDLFDACQVCLADQGLIINEGTAVDATIIQSPKGKTTKDGLGNSKDKAATHTKKHGQKHHGYKAHIATDMNGMIKDYVYSTAKDHDSRYIDALIEDEEKAVYADAAYMSKKRKKRLQKKGVFCGIIERRVRGQEKLTDDQEMHNKRCSRKRSIVEMPFAWLRKALGYRTRYRGMRKNANDFGWWAIAYNFKRSLSLTPAP